MFVHEPIVDRQLGGRGRERVILVGGSASAGRRRDPGQAPDQCVHIHKNIVVHLGHVRGRDSEVAAVAPLLQVCEHRPRLDRKSLVTFRDGGQRHDVAVLLGLCDDLFSTRAPMPDEKQNSQAAHASDLAPRVADLLAQLQVGALADHRKCYWADGHWWRGVRRVVRAAWAAGAAVDPQRGHTRLQDCASRGCQRVA